MGYFPDVYMETRGHVLRAIRLRRNYSLLYAAAQAGWQNQSYLSQIETNKQHLTLTTVQRMIRVLRLTHEEETLIYCAMDIPLDDAELRKALDALHPTLLSCPSPMSIINYRYEVLATNPAWDALCSLPASAPLADGTSGEGALQSWLECIFSPQSMLFQRLYQTSSEAWELLAWHELAQLMIMSQRYCLPGLGVPKWLARLTNRLSILPEPSGSRFRQMWEQAIPLYAPLLISLVQPHNLFSIDEDDEEPDRQIAENPVVFGAATTTLSNPTLRVRLTWTPCQEDARLFQVAFFPFVWPS